MKGLYALRLIHMYPSGALEQTSDRQLFIKNHYLLMSIDF